MKRLAASSHFQKQLKKLPRIDQQKIVETLKDFLESLKTGKIAAGYGFKKINGDKFEIRADIKPRIVMKLDGDTFVCHMVGNHEDVRRYLRTQRSK